MLETGGTCLSVKQGFVHGAMLLAGAAVLSKLLGSVYTIVLQNVIGDHGMGLFQMAYPIYATLLAIATAGFPVAISKMVSERLALQDVPGARRVFHIAMLLLCAVGVIAFFVLFLGASFWAQIAGDQNATWAIRAIAPALLIVPVVSAIRGYFQGYQWMEPTASSQVVEQFIRVGTILGLAMWLMAAGYGEKFAAAGAAFGAVTGAVGGLVLLVYYWHRRHPHMETGQRIEELSTASLVKQLIFYAFPISLGALVVPLMNNIDVITVANLLKKVGDTQQLATTEFGLLSGRASKLMMLPTTLASGIGIAVMPAVSEAFTLGFRRLMAERIDTAIRLTVMLALPAAVGLAILARPVDITLFKDAAGVEAIQMMAFATVFASVQLTVAAVLQGSGRVYLPVFNLLIACLVKLLGNLILVPESGIVGAAESTVISYAVATVLNFLAMRRHLNQPILWWKWGCKPAIATFIMGGFTWAAWSQWSRLVPETSRLMEAAGCCLCIGVGIIIYGIALLATGSLSERELRAVPKVGDVLANLCLRIGLLRVS